MTMTVTVTMAMTMTIPHNILETHFRFRRVYFSSGRKKTDEDMGEWIGEKE